jgi:uncharacterized protein with von Willebrand factor type A (vWA) domain
MAELIQRLGSLSENLIAFCRYLRERDFRIGPAEEADALRALEQLAAFDDPDLFQGCLRATLVRNRRQQQRFDELYAAYWRERDQAVDSKRKDAPERKKQPQRAPSLEALKNWLYGNPSDSETELAAYSPGEHHGQKDFAGFSDEELQEIMRLLQQLLPSLTRRRSRRKQAVRRGLRLDPRQTLRRNLRRGGELMELVYTEPKPRRARLILLCDVSKSMDLYSRFLVQFMYGSQKVFERVEAFVFSTSLQRVTPQLERAEFKDVLRELSETVPGWSGGTRIGASLATFVERYRRLLDRNSTVLILSDGWDTGEPEVLEEAMRQLRKHAHRIVWLNPLAGRPGYEPSVRGMRVALPYLDAFGAAHSVASLRASVAELRGRRGH